MAKKKKKSGPLNEWIEWIPVTRGMPEEWNPYLVLTEDDCGGRVQPVVYLLGSKAWVEPHSYEPFVESARVTHWAEWPKGPDTAF